MNFQREYSAERLVLDTTYILPLLGVKVLNVDEDMLKKISKHYELHYPMAMISELVGVILKQCKKERLKEVPENAVKGLNSLLYSGDILIDPLLGEDLRFTYHLYKLGLNDLFDNILYCTAIRLNAKILTLDKELKEFLKKNGLKHQVLITNPKSLLP